MTEQDRVEYFKNEISRLSNQVVDLLDERDQLKAQVEQLKPLARRCLWGAVNWNDHNFEPLHKYLRKSAADAGVFTVDQANALLEQTPAQCLAARDAEVKAQAVSEVWKHFNGKFRQNEKLTVRDVCWMLDEHLDQLRQQADNGE